MADESPIRQLCWLTWIPVCPISLVCGLYPAW
uniref:Uncharacterized protein n=1 Tax=Arundo donax TaxID=35708 RepID=A0A0A9GV06_ARUDO